MKLYKYKSLANLESVLDIILNERLFCSSYDELNDPFEGLFLSIITLSYSRLRALKVPFPPQLVNSSIKQYKGIEELSFDLSKTKICSLSSDMSDVRLWSHYADGHKGIVIEIDFSGLESKIHEVKYSEKLPVFEASLLTGPLPCEVLSCKTIHWKYEKEYRVIHEHEFFPISKRIKGIYLGTRISDTRYNLLTKIIPDGIPIYRTKINEDEVLVEPNETVEIRE